MFSFFSKWSKHRETPKKRPQQRKPQRRGFTIERLEDRTVLSAYSVLNLNNSGAGSLRQAITDANAHAGADVINFAVAGTIGLTSALPNITGNVDIDGTTAPGYTSTPVVEIDFNGAAGLRFNATAAGSTLSSLSITEAAGSGVILSGGGQITIEGNYIGVELNGTTASANTGSGLEINGSTGNTVKSNVISGNNGNGVLLTNRATLNTVTDNIIGLTAAGTTVLGNRLDGVKVENSTGNVIGQLDPLIDVTYNDAQLVPTQPVSYWQGIRGGDNAGEYLIVGTSGDNGLLFEGTIEGVGNSYTVMYPNSFVTSVYGPENLSTGTVGNGDIRLVGSYRNADFATAPVEVNGFLFEGSTADLANPANYRTIDYPGSKYNFVHSTMGGLAVGNYDSPLAHGTHSLPLGPGHAYIYDIASDTFLTDVVYPGSLSNTAYGIWHNGETKYTIVGGWSPTAVNNLENQDLPIGNAYMVDYDSATGLFSNWTSFNYPSGTNYVTHFEGISSVEKGVYTLNADSVQSGSSNPIQGSWVSVRRNTDGTFGTATWVDLNYPGQAITSSNSVYGYQVVGIATGNGPQVAIQATINVGFQLSNVISGNGGNGIGLYAANDNRIAMNNIGTDVTGTLDRGNAVNGVLVTNGSARNTIGGEATGGNDPTGDVFVRPPQGNLISGNNANGVLITGLSSFNQLSGNFIGTAASGNSALGNTLDGVAIVGANNNSLVGCTFQQDPFVFYNVISGNGGNGLRVNNSNDTTIQANFFGMGANNNTRVGNVLNGVVVEGNSTRTLMGGPIPLGNVDAANGLNGIVVKDTASYFTTYNTFCGLAAFSDDPTFGNGQDGMLITSTGGNILIRTNVITRNGDDGIEISGNAQGVRVAGNIIGLNTNGLVPMGNLGNGVEVGGNAHDLVIGGPQPTFNIIPNNIISANHDNGVAVVGTAHNITVSYGYIGTDVTGQQGRGNTNAGVLLGAGTYSNTVGSPDPTLLTVISGNGGSGIEMQSTRNNTVVGTRIGVAATGVQAMSNAGSGILIVNSNNNVIGKPATIITNRSFLSSTTTTPTPVTTNLIAYNVTAGVFVQSGSGNSIRGNSIHSNIGLGIDLATGANANQAAPVLTSVQTLPQTIAVSGSLTSRPGTTFTVEVFASYVPGSSGNVSLGTVTVVTNRFGVATFTYRGALPPVGASFITATATDSNGNTSEFSAAIQ